MSGRIRGYVAFNYFRYFCVDDYVSQYVFGHVCPPHSTYTAPRQVPTGPVHAQISDSSYRAGFALSRREFVEAGAQRQRVFSPASNLGFYLNLTLFKFAKRRTIAPETLAQS